MKRRVLFAAAVEQMNGIGTTENLPYQIEQALTLEDAWSSVRRNRYDLICIDASLTHGHGISFARELRAHDGGPPMILTGRVDCARHRADVAALGDAVCLNLEDVAQYLQSLFGKADAHMAERARAAYRPASTASLAATAAEAEKVPRILAYSHDSIGLGHMRRNANIVSRILEAQTDATALMVVGTPAGFVFDLPDGMDFVKLPSLSKATDGTFHPAKLHISDERAKRLRVAIFRQTVEQFEPDVLLVDHVPLGIWSELKPTLEWLRQLPNKPHVVLGLRDILDTPERVRQNWRDSGAASAVRSLYDSILIYGEEHVFDTAGAYGLEDLAPGRVKYCGYVANSHATEDTGMIRAKLGATDRPLVLLSGGGGRDAFPVLQSSLKAIARLPLEARPAVMLVAGPLMPAVLRAELCVQAENLGCNFAERVPNFPDILAAADLLVGMGGYNSVNEALSLGVPTLIVPREGPSAEQKIRAELLAALGHVNMMSLNDATPENLGCVFSQLQKRCGKCKSTWEVRGATEAAEVLGRIARDRAHFRSASNSDRIFQGSISVLKGNMAKFSVEAPS